jgi:hypothetical protein
MRRALSLQAADDAASARRIAFQSACVVRMLPDGSARHAMRRRVMEANSTDSPVQWQPPVWGGRAGSTMDDAGSDVARAPSEAPYR